MKENDSYIGGSMGNIQDYLAWRGDIPFSVDPFNEVDNLILSELVYAHFDGIVPGPGIKEFIRIADAKQMYFQKFTEEEIMDSVSSLKVAPFLLHPLSQSKRFQQVRLTGFQSYTDEKTQVQFACMTFLLPDGSYYVAYRGTDHTVVGWKEDFNMCFLYKTPGQVMAMEYLNRNFKGSRRRLRVGGHSKGGNFAVFASAFCNENIQKKIIEVYSNDGPGFRKEVLKEDGYLRILPRIRSIVPEQSIVSMLFENRMKHHVIQSSAEGASQHNPMTWQVLGNRFVLAEALSEKSLRFQKTFHDWLSNLEDEKRRIFVDELFGLISMDGREGVLTLDDLVNNPYQTIVLLSKNLGSVEEEHREVIKEVLMHLAVTGTENMKHSLLEETEKRKNEKMSKLGKNKRK